MNPTVANADTSRNPKPSDGTCEYLDLHAGALCGERAVLRGVSTGNAYCLDHGRRAEQSGAEAVAIIRPKQARNGRAEKFFINRMDLRGLPGHCRRCGREHEGKLRVCPACKQREKDLRKARSNKALNLSECMAMVRQCRKEVTKLRDLIKKHMRTEHNAYQRGYKVGRKEKAIAHRYGDTVPEVSGEEAAQISHAFDHGES